MKVAAVLGWGVYRWLGLFSLPFFVFSYACRLVDEALYWERGSIKGLYDRVALPALLFWSRRGRRGWSRFIDGGSSI